MKKIKELDVYQKGTIILVCVIIFSIIIITWGIKNKKKTEIIEQQKLEQRKATMNNPLARQKIEIKKEKKKVFYKDFSKDEMQKMYLIKNDHLKKGGRINNENDFIAMLDAVLRREIKPEDAPIEFFYDSSINDDYMKEKGTKKEAKKILEASKDVLTYNYNQIDEEMHNIEDYPARFKKLRFETDPHWYKKIEPDKPIQYQVSYKITPKKSRSSLTFILKKEKDIFDIVDGLDYVIVPHFIETKKKKKTPEQAVDEWMKNHPL